MQNPSLTPSAEATASAPIAWYERPPTALAPPAWMHEVAVEEGSTGIARLARGLGVLPERGLEPLEFYQESTIYLDELQLQEPEHFAYLVAYERELAQRWPADRPITVAIAAASHEEGENLKHTLEQYAALPNQDEFEVVVFLNDTDHPLGSQENAKELTQDSLRQFIHEHPDFPVRYFNRSYESGGATIGSIKKLLHDVVILRHNRAGSKDPILILNDADLISLSSQYVAEMVEPLRNDPALDAVAGHLDWDAANYYRFPELHFATRLYQIINRTLYLRSGDVPTPGASTAVRMSSYCAAGGTARVGRGEDVLLGLSLASIRGSNGSVVHPASPECILETSSRRDVMALRQGLAPNEKWKMGIDVHDPRVRSHAHKKPVREVSLWEDNLADRMKAIAQKVIDVYQPCPNPELLVKAFGTLGVDACVGRHSRVLGLDIESARRSMGQYRENYMQGVRI